MKTTITTLTKKKTIKKINLKKSFKAKRVRDSATYTNKDFLFAYYKGFFLSLHNSASGSNKKQ